VNDGQGNGGVSKFLEDSRNKINSCGNEKKITVAKYLYLFSHENNYNYQ